MSADRQTVRRACASARYWDDVAAHPASLHPDTGTAAERLTAPPADLFGIKDRGRLKTGYAADIAIFDPATIGSANRGERHHDLPSGAKRMVMPSRSVEYTTSMAW